MPATSAWAEARPIRSSGTGDGHRVVDMRMKGPRPLLALVGLVTALGPLSAQTMPSPPTRDPHTPGYVRATELPDGAVPPIDADGNFIIGPTHPPAPEMAVRDAVPKGVVHTFTMSSADSRIYPGIAREPGTF